ncbi:MAG: glutathione S-transferase family protein [Parvularculaceae bacterium]
MTLTVYHSPMMRSLRVIWLLEEMGITDYDLKLIPRADVYDFAKTPEYQAVNPLAKFPAITDGDLTMVESTAIMEYLLDKYGDHGLVPERGTPDYGRYLQWLHFGESGMGTYGIMLFAHTVLLPEKRRAKGVAIWAKAETDKCLEFLGTRLEGREWLCGDQFTAADISVGYMLYLLKMIKQFDSAPQSVKDYWNRVKARPAFAKMSRLT